MNSDIRSILRRVTDNLGSYSTLGDLKGYLLKEIGTSHINSKDKQKMLITIANFYTKDMIVKYVWNALLKYEGDGIVSIK
jgi:hypothetical protein